MNSLAQAKNLQKQAENLVETLEVMADTHSGTVRLQLERLSLLAFKRYQRRRKLVSQEITNIWGQA